MMLKRYHLGLFLIMNCFIGCHAITKKSHLAQIVSHGDHHGVTAPKCDEDDFCTCHYDKKVNPETGKPTSWEITCKPNTSHKDWKKEDWKFECKKIESKKNEQYSCLLDDTRKCKVIAGECQKDSDCCPGMKCYDPFSTGKTICWAL